MRTIRQVILSAAVIFTLSGCAVLGDQVEWASDKAADAVGTYCGNLTPDQRQDFGARVRTKSAPHTIDVVCSGDD